MFFSNRNGSGRSFADFALVVVALLPLSVSDGIAAGDLELFGPKRYDRFSGAPTVYTDSFAGCGSSKDAILRITNGKDKSSSITAGTVTVNGRIVVSPQEFKQQGQVIEKPITVGEENLLRVVLNSGGPVTPFIVVDVIGKNCDTIPPLISGMTPADGTLLSNSRPTAGAQYRDGPEGSGIDRQSVRLAFDGVDVTSGASVDAAGVAYTPASPLPDGTHTAGLTVADLAGNSSSTVWHFTTDTVPPSFTITSHSNNQFLNTPTTFLAGTVDDPKAIVAVNGRRAEFAGSSFTLTDVSLVEGTNPFTIVVTDQAGNSSTGRLQLNLDMVAPTVTISVPAPGATYRNNLLNLTGAVSEGDCTVTVNGVEAAVDGTVWSLSGLALVEGENRIEVKVTDRAGNSGSAGVKVIHDSTPPAAPVLGSTPSPTNTAMTRVSGTAEANGTVRLFRDGAPVGSVSADGEGRFSLAEISLGEGRNSFTATATDRAGNESAASIPVEIVLDTKPPAISVTAPGEKQFVNQSQLIITGNTDETVAALTVNGQAATVTDQEFQYPLVLISGLNTITLTATDLAGNTATNFLAVTLDAVPPSVSITSPLSGLVTNNPRISVSGTLSETEVAATVNGEPVSLSGATFDFPYSLDEGDNTIAVEATDRAGNKGTAAVSVFLDTQAPVITLEAPPEATAGANVAIAVHAADNQWLSLVELKADGVPIWSAESAPSVSESVSYRFSPSLSAGAEVVFQARGIDPAGNEGTASRSVRVAQGAMGPGFLQGRVLDDGRGLPMEGATVEVTDAGGNSTSLSSSADGGYFLDVPAGTALVRVSRPGYLPVERSVPVLPEKKATVLDARLTKVNDGRNLVDAAGGEVTVPVQASRVSPLAVELVIPAGALPLQADVRLTPLSNQGLPGILPPGWSPVAAADIRFLDPVSGTTGDGPLASLATLKFPLPPSLPDGTTLTLASYDAVSHRWIAAGGTAADADCSGAAAEIETSGQYALIAADPAPVVPPAAEAGKILLPAAVVDLDWAAATASGKVVPQASPPSAGLKAAGEVLLTAREGVERPPQFLSGMVLESRVTESFDLNTGERVTPPSSTQQIVLYRFPCVTNIGTGALADPAADGLRTTFPVSPSRDYTIVDLLMGKVGVEILKPSATESGVMVGVEGGRLVDADGNVLFIPSGALAATTPVATKNASMAAVIGDDLVLLKAVEVNVTGQTLARPAVISIAAPAGLEPGLPLLVAKQIEVKGVAKLKLVGLARQTGALLSSDAGATDIILPGITGSGFYCFLQAKGPVGFVQGTVSDAGNSPFVGALVKTDRGTLVDLVGSTGRYLVAIPASGFTVTAADLYKFDQATGMGEITVPNRLVSVDLRIVMTPPVILSVSPASNATNVQPSVPVTVTFSKAIEKSSISSQSFRLSAADGTDVPGVFTFGVDGRTVTFTPAALLTPETTYTVTVAGTVRDLQGYPLGQGTTSSFTVRKTTPPPLPAAGNITGTFPDGDGFISVTATQGSAEPENTVFIMNDTSGEIVSVTPGTNGSFAGRIRGQLGDEIKVILMDRSGNQTVASYLTFKSDDGRYLVSAKGGKVEGEGGILLDIPEGALVGPTVLKVTPVPEADLPHPVPDRGKLVGAVNVESGGLPFQKEVQLSIPVPADLPSWAVPFLAQPTELMNGDGTVEKVYRIIDSTKIINGRITTASPPFDGVMSFGIFSFLFMPENLSRDVVISGTTYRDMDGVGGYTPGVDKPIRGAVIRAPQAENFVSYSNSDGRYATFGFTDPGFCRPFPITAINPFTMYRNTGNIFSCEAPYYVSNFNFKLADRDTVLPDSAPPVIDVGLSVAPSDAGTARIIAGTVKVGTPLVLSVAVTDQQVELTTIEVTFTAADGKKLPIPTTIQQSGSGQVKTADGKVLAKYVYSVAFAETGGVLSTTFKPQQEGVYSFTVTAKDSRNQSSRTISIRVVLDGTSLGSGKEGPPTIDAVVPAVDSKDVMVTAPMTVWFSEPVENVSEETFLLVDKTTGEKVPATVSSGLENGRMQATLTSKGNLYYATEYEIRLTNAITDSFDNPSGGKMNLASYSSVFTTKVPKGYDLPSEDQFSGGRDIALYTFTAEDGESTAYAYVMAGENGWRIVDVTDPTAPETIHYATSNCTGRTAEECRIVNRSFSYRNVAINPDTKIMAITENNIMGGIINEGDQYGYIRFYDLSRVPGFPPVVGREKLAEGYSGIPGRVAMYGNNAYVATTNVGVQVVDVQKAIANNSGFSEGSSIIGIYDSINDGYGQPSDILTYGAAKAVLTTGSGNLLILDINQPFPQLMAKYQASAHHIFRAGVAADYPYLDQYGNQQVDDIAVVGTLEGRVLTLNLTDPYNPQYIATAKKADGSELITTVREISVSRDTGLAFVSTVNSVQVIDFKDPASLRLLTEISALPGPSGAAEKDDNSVQRPLGTIPAIVEKGGWVYLASQSQGMKVVDLDPARIDFTPEKIFILLDSNDKASKNYEVTYKIVVEPGADNEFGNQRIILFKGAEKIKEVTDIQPREPIILIQKYIPLDINAEYHAQVIVYDMKQHIDVVSGKLPIVLGKFSILDEEEKNSEIVGVVTDGASKLILNLTVSSNYKGITPVFSLIDPKLGGDIEATGKLFADDIEVTSVVVPVDPETLTAKVKYQAPAKFVRFASDFKLSERSVAVDLGVADEMPEIRLKRPPVNLVHGVWASPKNWENFEKLINPDSSNKQFDILKTNYKANNADSFAFNKKKIGREITRKIEEVTNIGFVASKVNYIGHSMGGLLLKEYCIGNRGCNNTINKYISIDSPHKGSELANIILDANTKPGSLCFEMLEFMESVGNQIWDNDSNRTKVTGALVDLAVGSDALKKHENFIPPFPWRAIVGIQADGSFGGVDGGFDYWLLWAGLKCKCGLVPDNSFPSSTLLGSYKPVFTDKNDRIVTRNSQTGISANIITVEQVNHSSVLNNKLTIEAVKQFLEE